MASFGWKRKAGEKVSKATVRSFEAEADAAAGGGGGGAAEGEEVDWLHAIKRRREVLLEDCQAKSKRMKDEGTVLAEQGRHWEAIKKWDEAIQLTPDNPLLYEMKSQVLTILHEVFPAVQAAEMAVKLRPLWWEAWQTLGRAQLSLGEVDLAVKSFQVAIHLCPSELPLWTEDLSWARGLQQQSRAEQERARGEEEARRSLLELPELLRDYDFEGEEVVAACGAVAERQRRYEEMKRTAVVIGADGAATATGSAEGERPSQEEFVKARGL